ncbi:MAG TPA: 4Fe-4S dicluster domain-containing protein [Dehalococcoidia bacterium]|nr:4Fe-4S dicluster domain-containing protein [Dehalococcoidia bacterium]
MTEKAILYDSTSCIACRGCQVACKQWNDNPLDKEENWGDCPQTADISASTWLKIMLNEAKSYGDDTFLFTRRACMHCTDAACIKVCPTGALSRHELGFVTYDKDICSGCGYCMEFCPFGVPQSTRNTLTGAAKMDKCTLCTTPGADRMSENYEPACVKTCPTDALVFGDRDDLVILGNQKVSELKDEGYNNASLYGENELGGLHVLYVLEDSPDRYGLPLTPEFPAMADVWQDIIQPVGLAAGGLLLAGLGLNYIIASRAKAAREKAAKKEV